MTSISEIDKKLNLKQNNFNIIRLFAASLVLFSHSYPLSGKSYEFFAANWGVETGGGIGVSIFFILSGFLVTRSLIYSGSLLRYIWARVLRIFPALIAVILLTVFILGPLITEQTISQYLSQRASYVYLENIKLFPLHDTLPGVFSTNPLVNVNGSLWTLPIEVTMYGLLLLIFLVISLTKSTITVVFTFFLGSYLTASLCFDMNWSNQGLLLLPGVSFFNFAKLGMMFFLGSLSYVFRESIPIGIKYFPLAIIALWLAPFAKGFGLPIFAFSITYLIMFVAFMDYDISRMTDKLGDISYGMYIYAFPVQQSLVHYSNNSFSVFEITLYATLITTIFAYLSYHLLEKKVANLKDILQTSNQRIFATNRSKSGSY